MNPPSNYPNGYHTASYAPPNGPSGEYTNLPRQPTVRIFCEASKDLSVTARNGTVVLEPADSNDHYQHWIKDMTYSSDIKDKSGRAVFALVNRVTGQALVAPSQENQPVSLVACSPNNFDKSVQWSFKTRSAGFGALRSAKDTALNLTAVPADEDYMDTKPVLRSWKDTPVQHWKMAPFNSNVPY